MVRAHVKQTPEEKKESHKKKTPSKKKVETGSWPCKINGCNKVFAREADLKRHQRTTKLHSMPGFACPQCDATFTRTDALRRHQKSRHNGVVIEPTDNDKSRRMTDGDGSSASKSPSRSGTPSRSQGDTSSKDSSPTTAQPAKPSGPSSYYRQHTMTGYPPRPPPGLMIDPHYPPIGLPTSATRLHQANWHPQPWGPDGQPLPPGPAYLMPSPYYQPSPYYRHPGMMPPMTHPPAHFVPQASSERTAQNGSPPGSRSPSEAAGQGSGPPSAQGNDGDVEMEDATSPPTDAPSIDPSLTGAQEASTSARTQDAYAKSQEQLSPVSENDMLRIAQAAVQAVMNYRKDAESRAGSRTHSAAPEEHTATTQLSTSVGLSAPSEVLPRISLASQVEQSRETSASGDADAEGEVEVEEPRDDIQTATGGAADESIDADLAHMLTEMTEDGEPMLNPADLLTQESLASPPPS